MIDRNLPYRFLRGQPLNCWRGQNSFNRKCYQGTSRMWWMGDTTHLPLHSFQIPSYLKATKKSSNFRSITDASKALFIKVCNTWLKVWTYCPSAIWKVYVQQKNPCCSSQKWICGVKKLSCVWCIARCQSCWLWMFTLLWASRGKMPSHKIPCATPGGLLWPHLFHGKSQWYGVLT